jgi:hypothetical protein
VQAHGRDSEETGFLSTGRSGQVIRRHAPRIDDGGTAINNRFSAGLHPGIFLPSEHNRRPMPILPGRCRLLLLMMVLPASGCGAETYRSRLDNTAQYFAYQQKLKDELGPTRSDFGVTFQPPKQFRWIDPPPPPEVDENGDPVSVDGAEDPRQPHYLGLQLPGLLGAWEATVDAEVAGQDQPRKAYLYLLGNHARHLQTGSSRFHEEPKTYLIDLENQLAGTIGVVLPEGHSGTGAQKNQRYQEIAPRIEPNSKFSPRKEFIAVTLSPQIDVGDLDLPFEMQLYEWDGRHIQVAVLMIYPQSISPRERLQERLLLSLETLVVNDNPPTAASQGGAAGGAPAGGTIPF